MNIKIQGRDGTGRDGTGRDGTGRDGGWLSTPKAFHFIFFHFKNSLRRGTLQQKCWFSRAPPTKIQILCMLKRKVVKNLRKNSNLKAKITNFNTLRKKKELKEQRLFKS